MTINGTETGTDIPGVRSRGEPHTPPTPYIQCELQEFWDMMRRYEPTVEYRQLTGVVAECPEYCYECKIFWFHHTAYMIVFPNQWRVERGKVIWTEPMRCFRIGCRHEIQVEQGHRYVNHSCSKCGYFEVMDAAI